MHSEFLGIVTMLAVALYLILSLIDSAELPLECIYSVVDELFDIIHIFALIPVKCTLFVNTELRTMQFEMWDTPYLFLE